jgi:Family of unknown function (DUF5335)
MGVRRLLKAEWPAYCDRLSQKLAARRAELEVVGLDLGDHLEARWLPVFGVVYEPDSDVFEIALEGLDHLIEHPVDVFVEETSRGVVAIEVVTADCCRQILKLSEPLPLQA